MSMHLLYLDKHSIYRIITFLFVLTQTLPFINLYIPIRTVWHFPLFLAASFLLFPNLISRRSVVALFCYIIIAFLFYLSGNPFYDGIGSVTTPLFLMTSGLVMSEYATKYDYEYKFTRLIVMTVIIANVIMSVISIPQIIIFPNIIRYTFSVEYMDNYADLAPWLITYQTCHGLPLLLAPLAFLCRRLFKNNKIKFLFYLSVAGVLLSIVYLSNATTALLIAIMMVFLAVFFNYEKITRKSLSTILIIGLLGLIFSSQSVMIPVLNGVQGMMDDRGSNYHKIDEIKKGMITGESEGDLGERKDLYETSALLFLQSPIVGTTEPEKISNHSWFLDRLACLGLFLIVPLILVFKYNIKFCMEGLIHTRVVYMYGIMGWFLMLILKNDFDQGSWLYGFAFLPLLCRYVDYMIDYNQKQRR